MWTLMYLIYMIHAIFYSTTSQRCRSWGIRIPSARYCCLLKERNFIVNTKANGNSVHQVTEDELRTTAEF